MVMFEDSFWHLFHDAQFWICLNENHLESIAPGFTVTFSHFSHLRFKVEPSKNAFGTDQTQPGQLDGREIRAARMQRVIETDLRPQMFWDAPLV